MAIARSTIKTPTAAVRSEAERSLMSSDNNRFNLLIAKESGARLSSEVGEAGTDHLGGHQFGPVLASSCNQRITVGS